MSKVESKETDAALKPPFISYKTFKNFLGYFQDKEHLPQRIDRGLLSSISFLSSGTLLIQMPLALRFFGLIDEVGHTNDNFTNLVRFKGKEWTQLWQDIFKSAYSFLFDGSVNIQSGTTKQFEDKFKEIDVTGETFRKAATFFMAGAKDADIPVSPYVKVWQGVRTESKPRKSVSRTNNKSDSTTGEGKVDEQPKLPRMDGPQSNRDDEGVRPKFSGITHNISVSGGRDAEFLIPDKLTRRDAEKLKKALQGLGVLIDSMVDEDEEVDSGIDKT